MENFEKEREERIKRYEGSRRLLLHSCCAPCSSAVLERLIPDFQITVYFYNPNIDGEEEYNYRLGEQKRLVREAFPSVTVISEPYEAEDFALVVKGLEGEKEGGARCERCFRLRLRALSEKAKEEGFPFVATTLTLSPLKNAELLNRIGEEEAARSGVVWLPSDFKKKNGYLRSLELSKQYELYRQNFCGCSYSKRER